MGTYLENYLESVSTLPSDVRRNFFLLRDLDSRSQELLEKIEHQAKAYIKSAKKQKQVNPDEEKAIKSDLKACLELGDEKVQLAVQTYELVDKHIRRLDMDLKKFEAELQQEQLTQPVIANKEPKVQEKKPQAQQAENGKAVKKRTGEDARVFSVEMDMPIDPHEPTYCICNRVSFGEMVGCDNPDCKIEWFHFECVGLTAPPKGKWLCPDCSALMKKRRNA
mmetsp:Transcript_27836/g.39224  ORF Transcript_27836/g.39224 Transcript_27836/m.39224 type:complete len:222 (+) Transcript_27836:66-731(+)